MLLESLPILSYTHLLLTSAAALTLYSLGLAAYRLFLSPISKFPGPWLAAATGWYEFYYDVIDGGTYPWKIVELHKQYGPIIRINPWELHVSDPDFYSTLYVPSSVRRTGMFPRQRNGMGVNDSHNATVDHDLHRSRRKPLDVFFSRQSIERIESMIAHEVRLLDEQFTALKGTNTVVNLEHAFASITGDIIGQICSEQPISLVTGPEFSPHWYNLIYTCIAQTPLFMHFPWVVECLAFIPLGFLLRFYSGGVAFREYIALARRHIEEAKQSKLSAEAVHHNPKSSLVRYIMSSDDLPESEKATDRLGREVMLILGAGTASTTRALNLVTYYAFAHPHIAKRLRRDLAPVTKGYPDVMPKWSEVEKVPYLAACIKEGLRLSYGILRRLPRTSPDVELQYKQWAIPKNASVACETTPVGMSAYMMHTDPEAFPEPFKFIPERWLGDYNPLMNRNFVPFSKGSRNCLGMNLVYAEMNLALAVIFRPAGPRMRIYETDESDVVLSLDWVIPVPKADSRGTRVMIE
ncbi:putative cytochrome P450 [Podospora didyma]|uniref:Cytochrome P450 n=1 Tax=Podospora didyma TaxID=330526 RepID=A0AAE0NX56_9PEZI|nr:putative cytochrome P450 [Podospora didyma]